MTEQQNPDRPQNDGQIPYPPQQPGQPYAQPGQPYAQPGQPYTHPGQPYTHPGQPYAQPYAQPAQPYAQPGQPYTHPGQPYARPGQPDGVAAAPYAPGPATARRSGGLGRTALVIAVSAVAIGLLWQLVTPFMYASVGFGVVDLLSNVVNLVVMAGAGVALVLGIIALRRPAPHLLPAIAIGVGGSTVVGTLVAWVSNVFYYFGF
ncbi:hypothetical protein [Microbacterium sp. Leaf161]|uniref:hypothetical protein n=1 Tax=Microbacterium sp. Leaf161 TaxID=1736281 RepID=UPI0009EA1D37|nr:hypothetical protein [Microbacterium sp. Leaf161]